MIKKFTKSSSGTPAALPSYIPPSLNPTVTPAPLPRLVVFDLDYTLWPFWVDTHPMPPFRASADHTSAADKTGESYEFYQDSGPILHALVSHLAVKVAAASRTNAPELAKDLLKMLWVYPPSASASAPVASGDDGGSGSGSGSGSGQQQQQQQQQQQTYTLSKKEKPRKALDFFDGGLEIYPGSKIRHFETLHRKTGIPYEDMLFFDDESRNRDVEALGVTMWLVRDGMTWSELEEGVKEWRKRRGY